MRELREKALGRVKPSKKQNRADNMNGKAVEVQQCKMQEKKAILQVNRERLFEEGFK